MSDGDSGPAPSGAGVAPRPGDTLGDYRLESESRPDRFFRKFKAVHGPTGQPVFLKLLRQEFVARDGAFGEAFEALAARLRTLSHPSLLAVREAGRTGDFFYVAEPPVDGFALSIGIESDHFLPKDKIKIYGQVAEALTVLRSEGLLHGNISPSTFFFTANEAIICSGYGFPQLVQEYGQLAPPVLDEQKFFCAPEVLAGGPLTERSEVYSLGALFAALHFGRKGGPNWDRLPEDPDEPRSLRPCLRRAMAADPERRHGHISEFYEEFLQLHCIEDSPTNPSCDEVSLPSAASGAAMRMRKTGNSRKLMVAAMAALVILPVGGFVLMPIVLKGESSAEEKNAEVAAAVPPPAADSPASQPEMPAQFILPEEETHNTATPTATPEPLGSGNAWLVPAGDWPGHFQVAVMTPNSMPWKNPALVIFDDRQPATREAVERLYADGAVEALARDVVRIVVRPDGRNLLAGKFGVTRAELLLIDSAGEVHGRFEPGADPAEFASALRAFVRGDRATP
ncbi:MAG: protein kinase [Sumerlaeia bacterium]